MKTGNSAVALAVLLLAILALQFLVNRVNDRGFYAADVRHPWNVLHETLVVRRAGGRRYGDSELDPFVWMDSEHLLVGGAYQRALRVLDDFLADDHQRLIQDPLKRAMLQHDLWGLFDWLADPECDTFPQKRQKLRRRIAQVIRRIALPMEDIQQLPDNYAALLASEFSQFGRKPDSTPIDLFDKDGTWVQLGYQTNGRIGTAHEENFATKGRSAFLMFVQLPKTHPDSGKFLSRFNTWAVSEARLDPETRRRSGYPSFPLPAGSRIALVRRMLVIDDHGMVRPTRITERIQLRELRGDVPENGGPIHSQRFQLLTLNRRELLAGRLGRSLAVVGRDERGFELGPIRTPVNGDPFVSSHGPRPPSNLMASCVQCHKHHGLLSLSRDGFSGLGTRPASLGLKVLRATDAQPTADWKASRPEFQLLRETLSGLEPFCES